MEKFINTNIQTINKNKINIIDNVSLLKCDHVVIYYDDIQSTFTTLSMLSMNWDFLLSESRIPIFFADINILEKKVKLDTGSEFVMVYHTAKKILKKIIKNTYDIFSLTVLDNIFTRDDLNKISGMTIVLCGSSSCIPCCRAMQHIPSMKKRYPNVQFKKVDYEIADRDLIDFLKPTLIPMFYVFINKSSMILDSYQNSDYIALSVKFEKWIEQYANYSVFNTEDF